MELRQIELFVAAAEEGHFSRAARRANIVQSGLSAAIRTLEQELGTLLFIRNTRRVELSEAGRVFLPEAYRILIATKAAREIVTSIKGGLKGRLSIGTVQLPSSYFDLPSRLQKFRLQHPLVEIMVRETYPEAMAEETRSGKIDLAFMPRAGVSLNGLTAEVLLHSPIVLATAKAHPLAVSGRDKVKVDEVKDEVFIDFSLRWSTRRLVDEIFESANVLRRTGFEVESVDLLVDFVKRGFGLALVPQSLATAHGLSYLPLARPRGAPPYPRWELALFRARTNGPLSHNPAADMFRSTILS